MKKTILFDIDDTLYDQVVPFTKAYEEIIADYYEVSMEELFVQSRKHSDDAFERFQKGEIKATDMYAYRIEMAFLDFHIPITREEALEFQAVYEKHQETIELSDVMKKLLSFCEGNVQLGIISNGESKHQWKKAETLGITNWIPKENIVISGDVGVAKPEKGIFEFALEKMHVSGTAYYIGDSFRNDMIGAAGMGLKTIWMNRRKNVPIEGESTPDYTVVNEQELFVLIKRLIQEERIGVEQ